MKLGRHKGMEVECQQCGNSFVALVQRVERGLGKFCSKECFNEWQRENMGSSRVGKDNAKAYPKAGGGYFVQWIMENGYLKAEIRSRDNHECQCCGEYVYRSKRGHVHHIDGNKQNCGKENLVLVCATCHNAIHGRNTITSDRIEMYRALLSLNQL